MIGVARFFDPMAEASLRSHGIETIRCDLLEPDELDRLPDVPNVIYLAGMKFGTTGREALTWAINALVPGLVGRRFRDSRIVALSTGNVYGPTPVSGGGSTESDPLDPRGEYAMSCVGRERILEHCSRAFGTPMALIRLNYATEMRYGVLVDLASKILEGAPIDLTTGYFNAIWQGDASATVLRAFEYVASPPTVWNVTGAEILSVRKLAGQFETLLGKPAILQGTESPEALLSSTRRCQDRFGLPQTGIDRLVNWTADWLQRGGPTIGKPTRYEVSDGRF